MPTYVVEWTLGAVLYEDEVAAILECETSPPTDGSDGHLSTARWVVVLLLGLIYTLQ